MLSAKDRGDPNINGRGCIIDKDNPPAAKAGGFTLKERVGASFLYGKITASEALRVGYSMEEIAEVFGPQAIVVSNVSIGVDGQMNATIAIDG